MRQGACVRKVLLSTPGQLSQESSSIPPSQSCCFCCCCLPHTVVVVVTHTAQTHSSAGLLLRPRQWNRFRACLDPPKQLSVRPKSFRNQCMFRRRNPIFARKKMSALSCRLFYSLSRTGEPAQNSTSSSEVKTKEKLKNPLKKTTSGVQSRATPSVTAHSRVEPIPEFTLPAPPSSSSHEHTQTHTRAQHRDDEQEEETRTRKRHTIFPRNREICV